MKLISIVLITLTICIVNEVSSEKILFLLPIATKSHKNVFDPLIKTLANKGHSLTVVSPGAYPKPTENIRELVILSYDQIWEEFDPFEHRRTGGVMKFFSSSVFDFIFKACEAIFQNEQFRNLVNEKFDLVVFNGFVNNCFDGLLYKLNAPFIMITAQPAASAITELTGLHLPPSFVPSSLLPFSDEMSFHQRFINVGVQGILKIFGYFSYAPKCAKIYRKYMGEDCPSIREIESNVSLIFMNSHHSITYPRPTLPDVIEVGGMHCRPAQPLPQDLQDFMSGAEHGVIYFSFGSIVKTSQLPVADKLKFLNVFSRLKQRVIWKWNEDVIEGLPSNVKISKWLPQQDILGHPNIRIFMTHGGLLSTQEAAYHGVTLLGIPIFADQDLNMKQAEQAGYALTLEILDFTEEKLESLIHKLLDDPQYSKKAKELSSIFRDEMQTPVERAVYWTEYLMRHEGASHLRSAARHLNFFQFHSLDVIFVIEIILFVLLTVLVLISKFFCSKIFRKKLSVQDTKKKL